MSKTKKPVSKKVGAKVKKVIESDIKLYKMKKAYKGGLVIEKSESRFVRIVVRAVIPTQQFGNIQPEITVEGGTYEEAKAYVMPLIEALSDIRTDIS